MQMIDPTYITDATLVSSDIPEIVEDYPEWDAVTTFMTGTRVSVTDVGVHKYYESLWGTGNLDKYPPDNLSGTPIYWLEISATNRWRLFDLIVAPARATMAANVILVVWEAGAAAWQTDVAWSTDSYASMTVTILPGLIDTVALINVDATSIAIILTDPSAGEVYNEVKIPPTATAANLIYSDIPAYPNASLQVTVQNTGGDAAVGELIVGTIKTLGRVRYGIDVGIVDFSQKQADAFGDFYVVERAFSKRVDCVFSMTLAAHSGVMRILEKYRTTPLVWILSDDYSTLIAYGYYRDFRIRILNPGFVECSLSIEGLGGDLIRATPIPDIWVNPWDGIIRLNVNNQLHGLMDFAVAAATAVIAETPVTADGDVLTALALPTVAAPILHNYSLVGDCTISHAEPAVVTFEDHGLIDDQAVIFHTTGTLPAPLAVNTIYYVENSDLDTFNVTSTILGSTIDTTTDGSGTHSVYGEV
jgi:hypothetical protein